MYYTSGSHTLHVFFAFALRLKLWSHQGVPSSPRSVRGSSSGL